MAKVQSTTLAKRFWAKVLKTDGCWLWAGSRSGKGYGKIHVSTPGGPRGQDGRASRKMLFAHRVAWELTYGAIHDGLEVLHNCPGGDNPRCVNPAHLVLGTHADNMRDAGLKKQMACGDSHPHAKLTEDDRIKIRSRPRRWGDQHRWAIEFGVSDTTISEVLAADRR